MKPDNAVRTVMLENSAVSTFGLRVLKKLAAGARGAWTGPDGYCLSGMKVPASLAEDLRRKDLVCYGRTDGGHRVLEIAEPGIYYVRRREAARIKAKSTPPLAEQYTAQHQLQVKVPTVGTRRRGAPGLNLGESPLGWLASRKDKQGRALVGPHQIEAAELLRRDFEASASRQRVTASYDGAPTSGKRTQVSHGLSPTEARLASKARLDRALDYVGPGLSDVLVRVCCHLEGLEQAEKGLGWPSRSAKVVLLMALDRLAEHYRQKWGHP